jgi:hypothetical protein
LIELGALYEHESLVQILFVTGILGGAAAWLAGRALALTWGPVWQTAAYMLLLGAAVRFVHFALFEATLLSPLSYGVDTLYLIVVGALSWRMTRAAQMAEQYHWLYARSGPLGWRMRQSVPAKSAAQTPVSG